MGNIRTDMGARVACIEPQELVLAARSKHDVAGVWKSHST